jgi:CoA:oxalate CoA-transferase
VLFRSIAPYDTFKTVDGYVSVGVSTNDQWAKFCKQMKLEYLVDDPRFTTNEKRGINYIKHLKPVIEELTHEMSKFELEKLLLEEKIPCGAVCTVEDIVEGKAVYEREMVLEVEDKSLGKIKMPGIPAKLYKTPGTVESAPLLGEHTVQYLEKIGYTAGEIENFKGKGIVEILKEEERS